MSTCRDCGARITWARSADGSRWLRPFEAQYTIVTPEDTETVVTLVAGEWRETNVSQFRMYKRHNCPEMDNDINLGRGRVRTVDEAQEEADRMARLLEEEAQEEEEHRLARMERVLRNYKEHQLQVDCPECYSTPGEPCKVPGTQQSYLTGAHTPRNLMTAFCDDQPWPPKSNQRGYRAMRLWLRENPGIFEEPALRLD